MKIYAPGKLILSGEHAVVYGNPALAMAINRYAIATISRQRLPHIAFHLSDLAHRSRLSFDALRDLKSRIKRKYHKFMNGEYTIRDVVQKPFELAQVALSVFADSVNLSLPHGVKVHVESGIPIGCGLGSSAATILSVMYAVSQHLNLAIAPDALFAAALEAENMQHGRSSGLDLRITIQGGCLYLHGDVVQARPAPTLPMYLVNTGTPTATTGQCVEGVREHFQSSALLDDFAAVTNAIDAALLQQSLEQTQAAIRENHKLLTHIGVVPTTVQTFIRTIENQNSAAKICGAGSISGQAAGAVVVITENVKALMAECANFKYDCSPITCEARGVHAI